MDFLDSSGLAHFWAKLKAYFVPQARKINSKALSSDITLTASDVGAATAETVNTAITNSRVVLTEEEYNALPTKYPGVMYCIREAE